MKYFGLILISIFSLSIGQDRSYIFNTGAPSTQEGFILSNNNIDDGTVVADRFYVANDYMLEAIKVWLKLVHSHDETGSVRVKLHHDSNNSPGEIIDEWDITLDPVLDYYVIVTVEDCHTMLGANYYWLSVTVNESGAQVLWGNSPSQFYHTSTSQDLGATWQSPIQGYAGAGTIWAEQIFYPGEIEYHTDLGDINLDGVVNILDIVQNVNYILGNAEFSEEQIIQADFNEDGIINILDIVQIVNHILSDMTLFMPEFMAEDINPNSEYFGEMVGPDTFTNEISCYYFGKAG